jgi:hypothetical protein
MRAAHGGMAQMVQHCGIFAAYPRLALRERKLALSGD